MFDNVRADLEHARAVNGLPPGQFNQWVRTPLHPGTVAVLSYRFSRGARRVRVPVLRQLLIVLSGVLRVFVDWVLGVEIAVNADIGPGLVVHTVHGVYVAATRIGRNCVVQHGVTISEGVRSIGDNVYFGSGAKVIGGAAIGNNVRVVANSVVMTDVPDDLTVVGVPARIRWRNRAVLSKTAVVVAALLALRDTDAVELISTLPMV